MTTQEQPNSLPEDLSEFNDEIKNLKDALKQNPETLDGEDPYTIEKTELGATMEYVDKKNPDNNRSFAIKNNTGAWEISEGHEGIISVGDLKGITLDPSELSNDENINNLSKILKFYGLPPITPEQVITISLMVNNQ